MDEYNFKLNNYNFIITLCIDRLNNLEFDTLRQNLNEIFQQQIIIMAHVTFFSYIYGCSSLYTKT